MSFLYLASPYTHRFQHVRDRRFNRVRFVASQFAREGIPIYSPIVHGHALDVLLMSKDFLDPHAFWRVQWKPLLLCSHAVVVLKIDGWLESVGVTEECKLAQEYHIPVYYMPFEPFMRPAHETSTFIRNFSPLQPPEAGLRSGPLDVPDGVHPEARAHAPSGDPQ